ncbi:MAG: tetratricopeptide repeat protein, partial [Spirochaetaceae bacterium]|nr:tetratricopeptide repeat protein [Spirochaetaceae bacterium]
MRKISKLLLLLAVFAFLGENCFAIPFEKKLKKENECAEYAAIADAYYEQKNYRKASEYYEKARKAPKFYDAMTYKLACSKALGGEYAEAKDLFAELLAKEPSNRTLRESLAYSTVMSGEIEAGAELYEALSIENPEDGNLMRNYIKVLIASGQLEKAEHQLAEYEKMFSKDADTEALRNKIKAKAEAPKEDTSNESETSESETVSDEEPSNNENTTEDKT